MTINNVLPIGDEVFDFSSSESRKTFPKLKEGWISRPDCRCSTRTQVGVSFQTDECVPGLNRLDESFSSGNYRHSRWSLVKTLISSYLDICWMKLDFLFCRLEYQTTNNHRYSHRYPIEYNRYRVVDLDDDRWIPVRFLPIEIRRRLLATTAVCWRINEQNKASTIRQTIRLCIISVYIRRREKRQVTFGFLHLRVNE